VAVWSARRWEVPGAFQDGPLSFVQTTAGNPPARNDDPP
jgi:hypothetical protein